MNTIDLFNNDSKVISEAFNHYHFGVCKYHLKIIGKKYSWLRKSCGHIIKYR